MAFLNSCMVLWLYKCLWYLCLIVVVYSQSRFMRSRISFSQLEGRMHALWRSRGAKTLLSLKFVAPSTSTHFLCLILRRLISWSNLFLLVSGHIFWFSRSFWYKHVIRFFWSPFGFQMHAFLSIQVHWFHTLHGCT